MDRAAAALLLLSVAISAGIVAALAASLRRARKGIAELVAAAAKRGDSASLNPNATQDIDTGELKRAVEEARERRARLEMALRGSQVAIFDFELRGNAVGQSNLDGYNIWESRGRDGRTRTADHAPSIELLVAPEDRERVTAAVNACVRGETPDLEVEYRSLGYEDHLVHWRLARGNVLRDANGAPVRFLGTSLDITSLKRAEEGRRGATELLQLATSLTNVRIWIFDIRDGRLADARGTFINWDLPGHERKIPAMDFATGIERTAVPEDRARLIAIAEACVRGEIPEVRVEYRAIGHGDGDGPFHWRLAHGTVQRDANGAPIRFLGTSLDINRLKRVEEERRRAMEAAETASRAKDEFLANVSHEIRTPMNAILGMTELALDSAATDDQKRVLSTVKSAARNLLGIINELLDFSKIEAGKLALDQADFSLRGELGDTLRAFAARANGKGLELICRARPDVPDALFGDAGRLRQVLTNLIGNALKFTQQGEVVVEVTTASTPTPADGKVALIFSVRDTGIGIAREKQVSIFRAFEQGDSSTTRKYGGTGLGLTISAQLAALMGGAITVESEPGRGSTFDFTAQFSRPAKGETGDLARSQSESSLNAGQPLHPALERRPRALRILVAEDNELNVALLKELLRKRGHRAQFVGDGRAALALASAGNFDLLLLDLHMPEMDGFEVVSALREQERLTDRHLPIIALTARATERDRERCIAAGIDDYISKPIETDALWTAVARVVAAFPPPEPRDSRLLDPVAIRRTCGGQAPVFEKLCEVFRRSLPDHVMEIQSARRERDLSRLRYVAHRLNGTLAAFSPFAAALALTLENSAARGEVENCELLVDQLESVCWELLDGTRMLTLDDLAS